MRRLSVALIAAVSAIVFTQIALAADLPTKAPVIAPQATYNWTGLYIGGNVGYGWGQADANYFPPGPPNGLLAVDQAFVAAQGSPNLKSDGIIGGVQFGYNYQFAPTWLLGVEVDFQGLNSNNSYYRNVLTPGGNQLITQTTADTHWLFTARGRVGYAADHWLIYGTGGLAVARINFEQANVMPDYPFTDTFSVSKTKTGWTAGGGVEYGFQKSWSVKVEYLYVDLGDVSGTTIMTVLNPLAQSSFGHGANFRTNLVRAGLNYRFN